MEELWFVLGPFLFLYHINDLPLAVNSKVRLFTDDCHPKDIVSSLRDWVLKERDGEDVMEILKSVDADNSRVLGAKLLVSNYGIKFSAKFRVFVMGKLKSYQMKWNIKRKWNTPCSKRPHTQMSRTIRLSIW